MSNQIKRLKPHKEDIFKIQMPMGGTGPVLVYNRDRDVYAHLPMTPELAVMIDHQYKIYVRAIITDDGDFQIIEKLGHQPW